MESEKKLQNRFKATARKYQRDCLKHGYTSWDCNNLLCYFNRSGHAHKNGKTKSMGYLVTFRNRDYRPEDIIQYFAIQNNNSNNSNNKNKTNKNKTNKNNNHNNH